MHQDRNATVAIAASREATVPAVARTRVWTKPEAMRKGLTWMGAVWLAGLVTLPIPVVHLIAPPAALIFGPLVGVIIFKLHNGGTDLIALEGDCPACKSPLPPFSSRVLRDTTEVTCGRCEARLEVRVEGGAAT